MAKHKGALPETYVLGSEPIYEDEVIKLPNGEEVKTGRRAHKTDIATALFTAAEKPVGQRLLRNVPAWKPGTVVGIISHWINEAAKRRHGGDMTEAEPHELVQVPVYRGVPARLAGQVRYGARRQYKEQREDSIRKRIVAELEKRRQQNTGGAEAAPAHG